MTAFTKIIFKLVLKDDKFEIRYISYIPINLLYIPRKIRYMPLKGKGWILLSSENPREKVFRIVTLIIFFRTMLRMIYKKELYMLYDLWIEYILKFNKFFEIVNNR